MSDEIEPEGPLATACLSGGGAMGALMRALDWAQTPLGPVEEWPQSLRTAAGLLLGSAHPACLAWGPELVLLYNDAYRSLLGPARHPAALGRPARDCWADAWDRVGPDLEVVLAAGEPLWREDEILLVEHDGRPEERRFARSHAPVRDEAGRVAGVFVTMFDTTERARAQRRRGSSGEFVARAEAAMARAEAVLDSINDVFLTLDRDWRFTYANRRALETLGHRPDELIGRLIWEVLPDLLGTSFEAELRRALDRQEVAQFELYYSPWESWYEVRAYPSPEGASLLVTDVTDWMRAQGEREALLLQLQRANALLDTLFENAPLGIGVWDRDLRFVRLNRALAEITGLPVEAHLGRTVAELLPGLSRNVMEALRGVVESGEPVTQDATGTTPAAPDVERSWRITYYPVMIGGLIAGVGAICEDVTDKKRVEAERELLLESEQEARLAAEEASRLKDEFLATVSHELRTPLNSVIGWARVLRAGQLEGEAAERALEAIERNAVAQAQLIEDLLDVSRIVTGQLRIAIEPTDLCGVVSAALDAVRPAAEAKGLALEAELAPDAGAVAGDAQRLQQVVWNLVSNAVKFTPSGGLVRVELGRDGPDVALVVSDTGQGIPPEFLPYAFERFRQADSSITRRHGGLGLGLAITRHIVELHGGTISVESPGIGRGATFTVRLPARADG